MTTELAVHQTQRVSLIASMASRYHMEPGAFQQTIKATVMPQNASNEQMAAFLLVANEYNLNPITKEIYAFPSRGGGVTPVVGVDGWINLAQRRQEFDGMEHEWEHDDKGAPISCTCRIWRKDRTRPVVVTEFMDECRRPTDPWKSHPRRMLRHKATIQAIRYAFGFAGIKDEDDAEVMSGSPTVRDVTPVATVDLNAKLAAASTTAMIPETVPEQANADDIPEAEWPKHTSDGVMVDARGMPFIEGIHSGAKRCNADGSWRRARGVDDITLAQREKQAMAQRDEPADDTDMVRDLRAKVSALQVAMDWDSETLREWVEDREYDTDDPLQDAHCLTDMVQRLKLLAENEHDAPGVVQS